MSDEEKKIIRVRDVMKKEFDLIDGRMTVMDVLRTMKHVDTKSLIVNKRHDDDEYGMVLISDIAKKVLAIDRSPDRVNVYEIMSKPLLSVDPNMDIRYCARLFAQFSLVRALVVEDDKVLGTISPNSLVLDGLFALGED